MEAVDHWMTCVLESHVLQCPRVAAKHCALLDLRMRQMEEKLPGLKDVFAGVKVKMAGSVLSATKVGESDEFDINVVIKLPFDELRATLNFDDSSPSYACVEVPEEIVKRLEDKFDIFAEREGVFHVSAYKLDQLRNTAVSLDLNSLNSGGGGGRNTFLNYIDFNCDMFADTMIYKTAEGWASISHTLGFKLDLVTAIQLPLSALNHHPTIPKSLERIKTIFPEIQVDNVVQLVPKTSPGFSRSNTNARNNVWGNLDSLDPQANDNFYNPKVSDWVIGLGSLENEILHQFDTPAQCLMLLKYFIEAHEDLPLWSYYLKTLVIQAVLDKPNKLFWSSSNLFHAFKHCLLKLFHAVSRTDLCDTFDYRLKLIQISMIDTDDKSYRKVHYTAEEVAARELAEEVDAMAGETGRKFVTTTKHKLMCNVLIKVVKGLDQSIHKGPDAVKEFFIANIFKLKLFNRVRSRVEILLLKNAITDKGSKKSKLKSSGRSGFSSSSSNDPFSSTIIVATEGMREQWKEDKEWIKYTDCQKLREEFLRNMASEDFQSEMRMFRTYLFEETLPPTTCRWCGNTFTNSDHIFWRCPHVADFWEDYCLKPGKWNKDYGMEDRDGFVRDLLSHRAIDLCSHEEANKKEPSVQIQEHKMHLYALAKMYLTVCQKVGSHPLVQELGCQMKAMRYQKTEHDGGRFWTKCPIPPSLGITLGLVFSG